jgi:hypothetical protein
MGEQLEGAATMIRWDWLERIGLLLFLFTWVTIGYYAARVVYPVFLLGFLFGGTCEWFGNEIIELAKKVQRQ